MSFDRVGIDIEWTGKEIEESGTDSRSGKPIMTIASRFFRPAEVDILTGDYSRAKAKLGWSPKATFKELVGIMVDHDLALVQKEG